MEQITTSSAKNEMGVRQLTVSAAFLLMFIAALFNDQFITASIFSICCLGFLYSSLNVLLLKIGQKE